MPIGCVHILRDGGLLSLAILAVAADELFARLLAGDEPAAVRSEQRHHLEAIAINRPVEQLLTALEGREGETVLRRILTVRPDVPEAAAGAGAGAAAAGAAATAAPDGSIWQSRIPGSTVAPVSAAIFTTVPPTGAGTS